jgi:hypothetical protein
MRSRRAAGLVIRWARSYTRQLPEPIAERRIDEIKADLIVGAIAFGMRTAHRRGRTTGL